MGVSLVPFIWGKAAQPLRRDFCQRIERGTQGFADTDNAIGGPHGSQHMVASVRCRPPALISPCCFRYVSMASNRRYAALPSMSRARNSHSTEKSNPSSSSSNPQGRPLASYYEKERSTFPSAPHRTGREPFNSSGSPVMFIRGGGVSEVSQHEWLCGRRGRQPAFFDGVRPSF